MGRCSNAGIVSVGSAVPTRVLTNLDLEKIVDTTDEWILDRTGISTRRIAEEHEAASDYAVQAARIALDRAELEPSDIGLVIVATTTGDMPFPATASIVQDKIGAKCPAFDLPVACSGWVYALSVANSYVRNGDYKNVLVVGVDLLSKITNWTDRNSCILFGDGAGAAIVSSVGRGLGFKAFELGSDGSGAKHLCIRAGGSRQPASCDDVASHLTKIYMDGHAVYRFARKIVPESIRKVLDAAHIELEKVGLIIPHQSSQKIVSSAIESLDISPDKFFVHLYDYGNTGAGSIPLALNAAYEAGRIAKGDIIVLAGYGAGLAWGASVMKWAY